MKHIDDPQLRFYLDRKELIDLWAGLRQLETRALDQVLTSMEPDVGSIADELGAIPHLHRTRTSALLGLHALGWQIDDDLPAAIIAIGWNTATGSFTDADKVPWIGVRVRRSEGYAAATTVVAAALHRARDGSGFPASDGQTSNWVTYRWEPKAPEISWDDLEPYRIRILGSLRTCWSSLAPIVLDNLDVDALQAGAPGPHRSEGPDAAH